MRLCPPTSLALAPRRLEVSQVRLGSRVAAIERLGWDWLGNEVVSMVDVREMSLKAC